MRTAIVMLVGGSLLGACGQGSTSNAAPAASGKPTPSADEPTAKPAEAAPRDDAKEASGTPPSAGDANAKAAVAPKPESPKPESPKPESPEPESPEPESKPEEAEEAEVPPSPGEGCKAVKTDLEESLDDDVKFDGCRSLGLAQTKGFWVELLDVTLDDSVSDAYGQLILMTVDDGDVSFEEVSESREVPGNSITYKVGKPSNRGGVFKVKVTETDQSFSTEGPQAGKVEIDDRTRKTIVCELAKRECDIDTAE